MMTTRADCECGAYVVVRGIPLHALAWIEDHRAAHPGEGDHVLVSDPFLDETQRQEAHLDAIAETS